MMLSPVDELLGKAIANFSYLKNEIDKDPGGFLEPAKEPVEKLIDFFKECRKSLNEN